MISKKGGCSTLGTAQESGAGRGLALCKELIGLIKGYLSLESETGKGTTVLRQTPATSSIPVIMITGGDEQEFREKAFYLGAEDFMLKPFREEEVALRARKFIW